MGEKRSKKTTKLTADESLLARYREKRRHGQTPERFGTGAVRTTDGYPQFMVHHHAARNTHFDLRLENARGLEILGCPQGPFLQRCR